MSETLSRFLRCFADSLDRDGHPVARLHATRLRHLNACLADRLVPGDPAQVPVQSLCEAELAERREVSPLAAALLDLLPFMHVTRSAAYLARPPSENFGDCYGYGVICGGASGPAALMTDPDISFGFLLLGPDTHYPLHHHPADELYHVVSGQSDWLVAGGAWTPRVPGESIHHPSWTPHATRTARTALVALYVWQGDLETDATFLTDPANCVGLGSRPGAY